MTEWHPDEDALVELALQVPEPDERARLSAHLAGCDACRARYAAIADGALQVLAASPSIAPPAGFSGRVLEAMNLAGERTNAVATRLSEVSRLRRRTILLPVTAALVLGLGVGVAGTVVVRDRQAPAGVATGAHAASALLTADGTVVGTVGRTTVRGRQLVVVTVTAAKPGKAYECVVIDSDGVRHPVGTWTLSASYGRDTAAGTWTVEAPAGGVARVELVTTEGKVWSQAAF
ncbi:hypothetical protein ACSDQ9_13690 [Aestuariimicrobium soli]|uniref:hypothetical protein n=1 Tax=Aestuariimicrobium soli TaxID=2035834 RepID=UPI003EB8B96B